MTLVRQLTSFQPPMSYITHTTMRTGPATITLLMIAMTCLLSSCDPTRMLVLKNKSNKPASFKWTIEGDSTSADLHYPPMRTWTYELGTAKNNRTATIMFGFGTWPKQEVARLVDNRIKSIEIRGVNTLITLTDKAEIKKFLIDRRHGLLKNYLTIKIH